MKGVEYNARKKQMETLIAIAEGLWNGLVVSGVLAVSAYLIKEFWILS